MSLIKMNVKKWRDLQKNEQNNVEKRKKATQNAFQTQMALDGPM